MSCWRRTSVYRIPVSKLGFEYRWQWNEFCKEHEKAFNWRSGYFEASLSETLPGGASWRNGDYNHPMWPLARRNPDFPGVVPGPFLDYKIRETEPLSPEDNTYGENNVVRPLDEDEEGRCLWIFRRLFPDLTPDKMKDVRFCEYEWYDGTDAPYMYSEWNGEDV